MKYTKRLESSDEYKLNKMHSPMMRSRIYVREGPKECSEEAPESFRKNRKDSGGCLDGGNSFDEIPGQAREGFGMRSRICVREDLKKSYISYYEISH